MSPQIRTISGLSKALLRLLDFMLPTWGQKLPAAKRFKLVLDGEAVLDKETGLVWEKSPGSQAIDWYQAHIYCFQRSVGDRKGWRLPTVEELASLVDPTQTSAPYLPSGHPFTNVIPGGGYWSSTTMANNTSHAHGVGFNNGDVNAYSKNAGIYAWCVRGGHGYDAY
ncbi:hypothetical protein BMS3Abin07_00100 [bacterium BMS3Abin07]|nr:hypothetical protein BMS3Abin07_00100 [bacterium BMS3Abin07]